MPENAVRLAPDGGHLIAVGDKLNSVTMLKHDIPTAFGDAELLDCVTRGRAGGRWAWARRRHLANTQRGRRRGASLGVFDRPRMDRT